jgi:acetyl esterase/lipase
VQEVRSPRVLAAAGGIAVLVVLLIYLLASGQGSRPSPASPAPSIALATPSPSLAQTAAPSASFNEASPEPPPPITDTPVPCGSFDPACARIPVDVAGAPFTSDVACGERDTCTLALDIFHPRAPGPWPVVVALPGGPAAPGTRSYLADFAQLVAGQGAVVFVADYRESPQWGGGSPITYEDIACAIRFARAHAAEYGGDGTHVSLVAHSLGPFFATIEALSPEDFEPAPEDCLTAAGSTKPDAFIGIAGIYSQEGIAPAFLESFFGGSKDNAPSAWTAGDPYAVIAAGDVRRIPIRLIHGQFDGNVLPQSSQDFEMALEAAGLDSQLSLIPGADHGSVLQHRDTIRIVLETILALR